MANYTVFTMHTHYAEIVRLRNDSRVLFIRDERTSETVRTEIPLVGRVTNTLVDGHLKAHGLVRVGAWKSGTRIMRAALKMV